MSKSGSTLGPPYLGKNLNQREAVLAVQILSMNASMLTERWPHAPFHDSYPNFERDLK